jgi:hypothetical protein
MSLVEDDQRIRAEEAGVIGPHLGRDAMPSE